ncbi:hypothetical protein FQZ97_984700 [compost metagenome]
MDVRTGSAQQGGQRRGITGREVTTIVGAQHAHVASDVRSQHRRAAERGLHDDVGTAFHAAGVHQHMGALDTGTRGRVRLAAEPAVVRAIGRGLARGFAQRRVERFADVVDEDAFVGADQARGFEQGSW